VFILLCGEPYGREYMSSENLSMKCAKLLMCNCATIYELRFRNVSFTDHSSLSLDCLGIYSFWVDICKLTF